MLPVNIGQTGFIRGPLGFRGVDEWGRSLHSDAKIFYVDKSSLGANDANDGTDPNYPLLTIQQGLDNCVSGRGDTVYVVRRGTSAYAENLTLSKARVSLRAALPTGNAQRVAVVPAAGVALDLQNGALSFVCEGFRFYGTTFSVQLAADGPLFYNCDFSGDDVGVRFMGTNVDTNNTGSGAHFERCLIRECGGIGMRVGNAALMLHATNVNIRDCQFYGNVGADISDTGENGANPYWYQWHIHGNYFMTTAKAVYLDMEGGDALATGLMISGNFFNHLNLTASEIILPDAAVAAFIGNMDGSGMLTNALAPF